MTATRKTVVLIAGLLAAATQAQGGEQNPPRPPASIPNVVALMPPTARLVPSAPTPIQHAFGAFDGRGNLASDLGYEDVAGHDPGGLYDAFPPEAPAPGQVASPGPTPDSHPGGNPDHAAIGSGPGAVGPPAEFDHPYNRKVWVWQSVDQDYIRSKCGPTKFSYHLGCAGKAADGSCHVLMADDETIKKNGWTHEIVLRHEVGHCNGWGNDHKGAR